MVESEWRQSTDVEISEYYSTVFPDRIDQLPSWISPNGPKEYAVALRDRYPVCGDRPDVDFIRRPTRSPDNPEKLYIDSWEALENFFEQPAAYDPKAIATNRSVGLKDPRSLENTSRAIPAAIYYALDNWEQFWVLAFDIDAKDVAKQRIAGPDQDYTDVSTDQLEEAGVVEAEPTPDVLPPSEHSGGGGGSGSFCAYEYEFQDIRQSLEYAFKLKKWLSDVVGMDDIRVFYSGQGAHVYANDDGMYYKFTKQSREMIANYVAEKLCIPIDGVVTWDQRRVIRLPYTLHTDVNRVVTEIQTPDYDFLSEPTLSTEVMVNE